MTSTGRLAMPEGEPESLDTSRPRVAVWRNTWLPPSETFIRNQLDALRRWQPLPIGLTHEPSTISAPSEVLLTNRNFGSRLRAKAFLQSGYDFGLQRWLKDRQVTLIHAHFGPDAIAIAPIARILKLPLVVTLHGFDVTSVPENHSLGHGYTAKLRKTLRQAEQVIAVSDFIGDAAVRAGARPENLRVCRIGIPVPAAAEEGQATEWDVLFVGRLVEKKGVADLIDAVAMLPEPQRRIKVGIIGAGPLHGILRQRALQLGLNFHFLGVQPPDRIADCLQRSRIFAAPSKTAPSGDSEGLGMVFLEAAAASIPAVSYAHGGVPEAVVHGVTGLLASEGDIAGLSQQIGTLLNDDPFRQRLGEQGRARVEQEFNIGNLTARLEDIYDDVVQRFSSTSRR